MLVLSRKEGDRLKIGDTEVLVLQVQGGKVRLGVAAPRDVPIVRHDAKDVTGRNRGSAGILRSDAA